MNLNLERLIHLLPPPDSPATRKDWVAVGRETDFVLPRDYIELVDTYGGGRFDEYLWVLEPLFSNRHYDLIRLVDERNEALQELWEIGEPKPAVLLEEGARVIPWASTENGEFVYWVALPGIDSDEWGVVVNEARGDDWEYFHVGCVEFLLGVLAGEIRSRILSESFPLAVHEFRPASSF